MKFFKTAFIFVLLLTNTVYAQVESSSGEISVFATVCERLSQGESKSSARLRASDKASFKAIEEIPELSEFRQHLDPHQFNLKIYKLVDNYLEDLNINVVKQSGNEVCVDVSAYILPSSIKEVFDDSLLKEPTPTNLEVEDENIEDNVSITIPPKPQIAINEQIAYNTPQSQDDAEITKEVTYEKPQVSEKEDTRVSLFIDKTWFYNDTTTNGFFAHLEQEVLKKENVAIHAKFDNSDYILKTKVLKAKIDNINSETGRLQVVVSVELTDTATSTTTTEHQNRFILFNTSEDTQAKASELVKKLFADGIEKILSKVKLSDDNISGNNIITPPSK